MSSILMDVYQRLLDAYGPQNWWPGDSAFEVMVGAVLTQNMSWENVEKAIANLREDGLLSPPEMQAIDIDVLAESIRSAGYYRLKARRLKNLLDFLFDNYDGDLNAMFAEELPTLRTQLLGVNGIGPETADSILLYAGGQPTFVVDTYTHRVLARHGWIEYEADYHQIKEHFESLLPHDENLFNEYHALLVRVSKSHCKKTPKCEECPLHDLLPDQGMIEPG